jgi:hypothetical protein
MLSVGIQCINRIVSAIYKKVKATKIIVRIYESSPLGVIVAGLEVIEAGFSEVDIAIMAKMQPLRS